MPLKCAVVTIICSYRSAVNWVILPILVSCLHFYRKMALKCAIFSIICPYLSAPMWVKSAIFSIMRSFLAENASETHHFQYHLFICHGTIIISSFVMALSISEYHLFVSPGNKVSEMCHLQYHLFNLSAIHWAKRAISSIVCSFLTALKLNEKCNFPYHLFISHGTKVSEKCHCHHHLFISHGTKVPLSVWLVHFSFPAVPICCNTTRLWVLSALSCLEWHSKHDEALSTHTHSRDGECVCLSLFFLWLFVSLYECWVPCRV